MFVEEDETHDGSDDDLNIIGRLLIDVSPHGQLEWKLEIKKWGPLFDGRANHLHFVICMDQSYTAFKVNLETILCPPW